MPVRQPPSPARSPAWSWNLAVAPLARLCSPLCRRSARREGCPPWYSASRCSPCHWILRSPRPQPRRRSPPRRCRRSVCFAISVRRPSRHPQSIASCSGRRSADRRVPCFPRRSTSSRLSPSAVLCAVVSGRGTSILYVPCSPPWSCSPGHYSLANYRRWKPCHRYRMILVVFFDHVIASQDLDTLSTLDHVFTRYHAIFSIMVL